MSNDGRGSDCDRTRSRWSGPRTAGRRPRWLVASSVVALVGFGCSGGSGPHQIDDVREVHQLVDPASGPATSAERFGLSLGQPQRSEQNTDSPGSTFRWTLPEGWEELTPTPMRHANFRVAGREDVECYLSVLPGRAGGVGANVNRWRGQMGLEALDQAALENLPHGELLGQSAVLVEMAGDYRGMGSEAQPDFRLTGLILEAGTSTVFLKMVGPAQVVDEEQGRFQQLAASLEPAGASRSATSNDIPTLQAGGIGWDTPAGWTRAPDRSVRVVTFLPDAAPATECYVTLLPGNAGGEVANVNRWRGQMGLTPLTPEEILELPRHRVLGTDALLVELTGDFVGMSGARVTDAYFLGLICELGGRTLFVKMTGPGETTRPEREAFLGFSASLRHEGMR